MCPDTSLCSEPARTPSQRECDLPAGGMYGCRLEPSLDPQYCRVCSGQGSYGASPRSSWRRCWASRSSVQPWADCRRRCAHCSGTSSMGPLLAALLAQYSPRTGTHRTPYERNSSRGVRTDNLRAGLLLQSIGLRMRVHVPAFPDSYLPSVDSSTESRTVYL